MYQKTSLISGARWYLSLSAVVLFALLLLNISISKAVWMNSEISAAQATQLASQIMIDYQATVLNDTQRNFYVNLEMQKAQQKMEFEQQEYAQQLQALTARNATSLEFQEDAHLAALFSVRILTISLGVGLIIASIFGGIGLNRYLMARAQENYSLPLPSTDKTIARVGPPSQHLNALEQKMGETEPGDNHRATLADIQNSIPIWTRKTGDISPKKYPRAE